MDESEYVKRFTTELAKCCQVGQDSYKVEPWMEDIAEAWYEDISEDRNDPEGDAQEEMSTWD